MSIGCEDLDRQPVRSCNAGIGRLLQQLQRGKGCNDWEPIARGLSPNMGIPLADPEVRFADLYARQASMLAKLGTMRFELALDV